jgi:polyketide synthase 12
LSPAERLSAARRLVAGAVATVLGHADAAALDPQAGFTDLGLDSLMAVELRNALQVETGLKLPATVTFEHPSIERLAHCVADRAAQSSAAPVLPEPPGADPAAPGAAAAAAWSDAAVRRKLAQVSIDALRDSGLLAQLMQQPDALPAATAAGASPAPAAQGSDGDDADILQALEAELGLGDDR